MRSRRSFLSLLPAVLVLPPAPKALAQSFDHSHAGWSGLLNKHVAVLEGGKASRVRYAGMAQDRGMLKAYLGGLSAVAPKAFEGFGRAQQMAFLINAYNAFTVDLVLTRYPRLKSIKDLGGLLQSPWQSKVAPLLGTLMSLDQIEHEMLRARGRFDDPRVHFAVNCASVGCPSLREEAFVHERLDAQLNEQTQRFMSDRSRNRWNSTRQRLEVSKIFDWFEQDFRQGHQDIASPHAFYARYADQLADSSVERDLIRSQKCAVSYLDYDWKLNDADQ
jgi:hypothetical protein